MPARRFAAWAMALGLAFGAAGRGAESRLDEALKALKVPPDWFADVKSDYNTQTPWKDARLHIRKLLAESKRREAIKLTYIYHVVQKNGSPDGHEYPMYLFLGGEYAWAAKVYAERLAPKPKGVTFEYNALASLYARFDEYSRAIQTLKDALDHLPDPPWQINAKATVNDKLGDVYAALGDAEKAREHYDEAIRLFPTSNQPYGRHLLHRHAAKTQAKLDLLNRKAMDLAKLKDGVYRGSGIGYVKEVNATVAVKGGKITDIQLQHEEKIDMGATTSVPRQIIERQSLEVDAVTGATVTAQAIVQAVYEALQRAATK
ncbi:MAG TPA: FMN-binding protein [Planctomycetota bacterium]|nr:FMN-binding protein [Planctomycetota bacterium]